MQSQAKTVEAYLKELPSDRREAMFAVRKVILENLPKGFDERMSGGMIGYVVPRAFPAQNIHYASLASQKNYMALYLMCGYSSLAEWFQTEYKKTGKKLDMGKCCVRFRKLEDLPLDLIGRTIAKMSLADHAASNGMVHDRKPTPRTAIRAKQKPVARRK